MVCCHISSSCVSCYLITEMLYAVTSLPHVCPVISLQICCMLSYPPHVCPVISSQICCMLSYLFLMCVLLSYHRYHVFCHIISSCVSCYLISAIWYVVISLPHVCPVVSSQICYMLSYLFLVSVLLSHHRYVVFCDISSSCMSCYLITDMLYIVISLPHVCPVISSQICCMLSYLFLMCVLLSHHRYHVCQNFSSLKSCISLCDYRYPMSHDIQS